MTQIRAHVVFSFNWIKHKAMRGSNPL